MKLITVFYSVGIIFSVTLFCIGQIGIGFLMMLCTVSIVSLRELVIFIILLREGSEKNSLILIGLRAILLAHTLTPYTIFVLLRYIVGINNWDTVIFVVLIASSTILIPIHAKDAIEKKVPDLSTLGKGMFSTWPYADRSSTLGI